MSDPALVREDPALVPKAPARVPEAGPSHTFGGKPWFWLPFPLLIALDLWSKAAAFGFLAAEQPHFPEPHRSAVVWDGWLRFELVAWCNPGTIWGLFPESTVPLMVLRCIAVGGLLWYAYKAPRRAKVQQLVLSLILAGALGNLYDNFVRADRTVRDFLRFSGTWPTNWGFPAFNVADACITVGAIVLFFVLFREESQARRTEPTAKG